VANPPKYQPAAMTARSDLASLRARFGQSFDETAVQATALLGWRLSFGRVASAFS
jgi:hypothetical protein